MAQGVLIVGELQDGHLASITLELVGGGKKLAQKLGQELDAVLLGSGLGSAAQELAAYGLAKVHTVDSSLLKDYQTDGYVTALAKLCQTVKPEVVLMGQTSIGRDLAPRLAFRLGTGVTMDCIDLEIDSQSKLLLQTKPVYGGNALAVYTCPETRPQMATVRAKAMEPATKGQGAKGQVVPFDAGLTPSQLRAKVANRVKEEVAGVKLEEANVVITGGRGLGGPEGFKDLEAFAKLLKGAVGSTRAAADAGWIASTTQVGLTGKIVAPTVYLAIGLSGSSQHLAGCSGSKNIIAINKDPDANIFQVSRFGVVGDYKKVLPALMEKVKQLLS